MQTPVIVGMLLTNCVAAEDRQASFSYLHATVVQPNCATSNCHDSLGASPIGTAAAGIQLEDRATAYWMLTGSPCDPDLEEQVPTRNFVNPGQPETSKLMYMLRGVEVRRMPPDSPLPDAEIELVERWILEGAQCN